MLLLGIGGDMMMVLDMVRVVGEVEVDLVEGEGIEGEEGGSEAEGGVEEVEEVEEEEEEVTTGGEPVVLRFVHLSVAFGAWLGGMLLHEVCTILIYTLRSLNVINSIHYSSSNLPSSIFHLPSSIFHRPSSIVHSPSSILFITS